MEKCKCCKEERKDDVTIISELQEVMERDGYISEDAIKEIAKNLNKPLSEVYGVATFYAQFSLEPKGKYEIKVCDGTACHVRGSSPILEEIKRKVNVAFNNINTSDPTAYAEILKLIMEELQAINNNTAATANGVNNIEIVSGNAPISGNQTTSERYAQSKLQHRGSSSYGTMEGINTSTGYNVARQIAGYKK